MYKLFFLFILLIFASCIKPAFVDKDYTCVGPVLYAAAVEIPDECCEEKAFGWLKIENSTDDTLYRKSSLATYYWSSILLPGESTTFRNENTSPVLIHYYIDQQCDSLVFSLQSVVLTCQTVDVTI